MLRAPLILVAVSDTQLADELAIALREHIPQAEVSTGFEAESLATAHVILAQPGRRTEVDQALAARTGPLPAIMAVVAPGDHVSLPLPEFDDVLWTDESAASMARRVQVHATHIGEARTARQSQLAFANHVRALYEVAPGPWLAIDEQISGLLGVARRAIAADVAALVAVHADALDCSTITHLSGSSERYAVGQNIPLLRGAWEVAIATPARPADVLDSPVLGGDAPGGISGWFLTVPVRVNGQHHGVVGFSSNEPLRQPPLLAPDLEFVRLIGRWIGALLERVPTEREKSRMEGRFRETQKLETLGVVIGGIAHDFNNLLMTILANSKLARMDLAPGSSALESVAQLELAARRAAELTQQMLAYAGKGRIDVARMAPSELVSAMGPLLSTVIGKRAELELELDETLEEIDADEGQLRQLLLNLVTNASDALKGRAGSIYVRTGLTSFPDFPPDGAFVAPGAGPGPYVYIEVEDDGCGMGYDTIGKMFDPFFTTKVDARGLGLAAVLGIVRAHRGAIQVTSAMDGGTRIRVLLPNWVRVAVQEEPGIPLVTDQPGVTVLVADDEEQLRTTLARLLVQFDFRVLTAADGLEAVQAVREHAAELDVVLLDLTMPELGGADALTAIRAIDPALPIMFMSGYHGHVDEAVAERDPLTAFVHKPFDPLTLIHRLGEMARLREKPPTTG